MAQAAGRRRWSHRAWRVLRAHSARLVTDADPRAKRRPTPPALTSRRSCDVSPDRRAAGWASPPPWPPASSRPALARRVKRARRGTNSVRGARVHLAMRHLRVVLPTAIAVAAACGVGAAPTMGATWTNVPSQAVGSGSALGDVDALSPTSAWAVGGNGDGIVERYDGTRWSAVGHPEPAVQPDQLGDAQRRRRDLRHHRLGGRGGERRGGRAALERLELEQGAGRDPVGLLERTQRRQGILRHRRLGRRADRADIQWANAHRALAGLVLDAGHLAEPRHARQHAH